MKKVLRWFLKILGTALTALLVLALFPYATRFLARIMPDEGAAAIRASAVISQQLETAARLETLSVKEESVLDHKINAAFIGTVASVTVRYEYAASFGIDLKDVEMRVENGVLTIVLPPPALLSDSLTPLEAYRDVAWYPYFDDNDYQRLLDTERAARRERYLTGEYTQQLWDATTQAFDETIAKWIGTLHGQLTIQYEMAEQGQP